MTRYAKLYTSKDPGNQMQSEQKLQFVIELILELRTYNVSSCAQRKLRLGNFLLCGAQTIFVGFIMHCQSVSKIGRYTGKDDTHLVAIWWSISHTLYS